VNVSNIKMGSPRIEKNRLFIQTSFAATAFAAVDEKAAAPKPPEKGKAP
jgi:hypothetical protein